MTKYFALTANKQIVFIGEHPNAFVADAVRPAHTDQIHDYDSLTRLVQQALTVLSQSTGNDPDEADLLLTLSAPSGYSATSEYRSVTPEMYGAVIRVLGGV